MPYLHSVLLALALVSAVLAQSTTTSSITQTTSNSINAGDPSSSSPTVATTSTRSVDPDDPFGFDDDPFAYTPSSYSLRPTPTGPIVTPTGIVVPITFPYSVSWDVAPTLVGSVVGITSALTTIVVGCTENSAQQACEWLQPSITITAGSSTYRATRTFGQDQPISTLFTEYCSFTASTLACTTSQSLAAAPNQSVTGTKTTTLFSSTYTDAGPAATSVTVTAGPTAGLVAAPSGNVSVARTSATTGTSSTFNHGATLVPGGLAAGLMGVAALLL